ncbi:hypothetical protein [Salinispora arenicola]|uniref:hypothetical protein n=1 Tax=Salinispora arenicola TaxID=168697 RepID=UPI00207A0EE7|nr:hypothetical protein [Salinispora arenicola]MCN0178106.1 hypothetical protein [Salinispora arenicola]
MDSGRLLDALGDLAGSENARQEYAADPDAFIGVHGHPGLPADLVNEAVSHYADVADPALAEHIAPTVMAHRGFGDTNTTGATGLDLLATAPLVDGGDPMVDLDGDPTAESDDPTVDLDGDLTAESDDPTVDLDGDPAAEASDPTTAHSGMDDAGGGEPWSEPASDPDASFDLAFGLGAQVDAEEEHDYGLDTDLAGVAVIVTAPLADIGGTGHSVHDLARVDGVQQPDEPWLGDDFDGDSA